MSTEKCVTCGEVREIHYSLPLKKEGEKWITQPVCDDCHTGIIDVAKRQNRFVKFYDIRKSAETAASRNGKFQTFKSIVEAHGQPFRGYEKAEKGRPPLRAVS
ncbi:MAG: hypothetical protein HY764_00210 [Candidatus Portnoybacteria bacterium]|nr:hypothetical protein [Candidatus Portnoybacteria bacterium]